MGSQQQYKEWLNIQMGAWDASSQGQMEIVSQNVFEFLKTICDVGDVEE